MSTFFPSLSTISQSLFSSYFSLFLSNSTSVFVFSCCKSSQISANKFYISSISISLLISFFCAFHSTISFSSLSNSYSDSSTFSLAIYTFYFKFLNNSVSRLILTSLAILSTSLSKNKLVFIFFITSGISLFKAIMKSSSSALEVFPSICQPDL